MTIFWPALLAVISLSIPPPLSERVRVWAERGGGCVVGSLCAMAGCHALLSPGRPWGPPENLEQSKSPHPPPGLARHRCLYCLLHRDLVQTHALHCTCMLPQSPPYTAIVASPTSPLYGQVHVKLLGCPTSSHATGRLCQTPVVVGVVAVLVAFLVVPGGIVVVHVVGVTSFSDPRCCTLFLPVFFVYVRVFSQEVMFFSHIPSCLSNTYSPIVSGGTRCVSPCCCEGPPFLPAATRHQLNITDSFR